MHLGENFRQAYLSLTTNKLRSILTMLGIVMGVFSVVAILAISNSAKVFVTSEFNKLGANTIMLQYFSEENNPNERFTMKDISNIKKGMPEVENINAAQGYYSSIRVDDGSRDAQVIGTSKGYTDFQEVDLVTGRFISEADIDGQRRVVIVTDTYANEYYKTTDILGEEIWLYNYYGDIMKFKIIGVRSTEADLFGSMIAGFEMPVELVTPLTTTQEFFGNNYIDQIMVSIAEGYDMKASGIKLVRLLEFTHQTQDVYYATSVQDIQNAVGGVLDVISMVLLVIAIITLVVGGIGIINILLVSVTERIREIGLRKAIGAKKRDIVMQFLTESIMMTGFSGLIGILLGVIMGAIISNVIKIPPVVDLKIITLTFLGSIMLGLIFGVYPAKKAADLDPIESLRYE